ncbi:hypothetical protein BDY19DRAFT_74420 [Irpex rosettiformis]|uniref:Uncharacterized protein n=1 Tax=Irpex rosettiformis TaxID=378272 RepID=A0ACB8ULL8_9APHY|nr:hypothetical protein BDY19DRAFT_74420 [Irpex rosettiformis]
MAPERNASTYEPLATDDFEGNTPTSELSAFPYSVSKRSLLGTIVNASIYVVAACAIASAWISYSTLARSHRTVVLGTRRDLKELERRSSYIDFDRLYRNPPKAALSASYGSIVNHARSVAVVSLTHPNKVFHREESYSLLYDGNSTVNSRQLIITSETSTISQFRILDWGMENCTVEVNLPSSSDTFTTMHTLSSPSYVNIWLLDTVEELDFDSLSFSTKPQRKSLLATLSIAAGRVAKSPSFRCPTASYVTVEIESMKPEYTLNITHIGYSAAGLYIRQSQSI